MADRPFRASYPITGVEAERVFEGLLQVDRFPDWAVGLKQARRLDAAGGGEPFGILPGTNLEFTLSAAGFTHRVVGAGTLVEPPRRLEWGYERGATGRAPQAGAVGSWSEKAPGRCA